MPKSEACSKDAKLIFSRSGICKSFLEALDKNYKKIAIACSGGPDSLALVVCGKILIDRGVLEEVHVIHVNHNIRQEAKLDMEVCKTQANLFGLPFFCYDVFPMSVKGNVYSNGRRMRYSAIQDHCELFNLNAIVTAHHADDVAETLIMNIARGCGPNGLCGISKKNYSIGKFPVLRPFLSVRKKFIENLCTKSGLNFAIDKSNFNTDKTRSFIRLNVIPLLEKVNPAFVDHASKTALLLQRSVEKK